MTFPGLIYFSYY